MPIELNRMESDRFGIVAARLTDPAASPAQIETAARARKVDMLTTRVSTDDLPRVRMLEDAGYRLMDTLVYYICEPGGPGVPQAGPDDEKIRLADPADAETVAAVARAAFQGYFGHYHSDPRLSDAAADAAYVEWAQTSVACCDPATAPALVGEVSGQIAGFLTLRFNSEHEAEIVLNAVHPDARSRGLYGRMVDHGLAVTWQAGRRQVVVSTQVNNIAVQKAWARRGFRMQRSFYTLHKWF
jgi:ribosomal protein S18 acetylase RimI-like enzyme